MATYVYTGVNAQGYGTSGSNKFNSDQECKSFLDNKGISGYTVFASKTEYKTGIYALVSPGELSLFCKQMSVLFFSHMTLMEGMQLLADQNENKNLKTALMEIYSIMDQGYTFATAINMYDNIFPTYLLNMITIGEQSGTLDSIFKTMSVYYDKEGKLRKRVRSAIAYPTMLAILMGAIVILLIIKILPMFNSILTDMGEELPAATALIFGVSNFLNMYLWIILAVIAVAVAGFYFYIRSDAGSVWYDQFKLNSFFTRYITRRSLTARIARSLSLLIRSGVQILNAMEIITPLLENKYVEDKFVKATQDLRDGKELVDVFESVGIFPPLFIRMVTIGQKVGHLDEMLDKSGNVFDDEVDDAIERLTVMIEPILIIVLSVIVGVILLSVMLPMIDIMTIIG
jgi:type IV pilus assembly protein PilC